MCGILFSLVAWLEISRFPDFQCDSNFLAAESEIFFFWYWRLASKVPPKGRGRKKKDIGGRGQSYEVPAWNRKHFNSLQIYSLRSPERILDAGHFLFIAKRVALHFHWTLDTGMKLDILGWISSIFFFRLRLLLLPLPLPLPRLCCPCLLPLLLLLKLQIQLSSSSSLFYIYCRFFFTGVWFFVGQA